MIRGYRWEKTAPGVWLYFSKRRVVHGCVVLCDDGKGWVWNQHFLGPRSGECATLREAKDEVEATVQLGPMPVTVANQ